MKNNDRKKKLTIIDIAKEANVSVATISRYFSDPEVVKQSTRDKLKKIIEKHSFMPSINTIRGRQNNKNKVAFLMNPKFDKEKMMNIIEGMARSCLIYDYVLSVFLDQEERREHYLDNAIRSEMNCLVLLTEMDDDFVNKIRNNHIKLVYLLKSKNISDIENYKKNLLIKYEEIQEDYFLLGMTAVSLYKKSIDENKNFMLELKGDSFNYIK